MATNWKFFADSAEKAQDKAEKHLADMRPADAAAIIEQASLAITLKIAQVREHEDPIIISSFDELASTMHEVANDLETEWDEALNAAPNAIRAFMWRGSVKARIQAKRDAAQRIKEYESIPPAAAKPLEFEEVIRRSHSALSEEFGVTDPIFFPGWGDGGQFVFRIDDKHSLRIITED